LHHQFTTCYVIDSSIPSVLFVSLGHMGGTFENLRRPLDRSRWARKWRQHVFAMKDPLWTHTQIMGREQSSSNVMLIHPISASLFHSVFRPSAGPRSSCSWNIINFWSGCSCELGYQLFAVFLVDGSEIMLSCWLQLISRQCSKLCWERCLHVFRTLSWACFCCIGVLIACPIVPLIVPHWKQSTNNAILISRAITNCLIHVFQNVWPNLSPHLLQWMPANHHCFISSWMFAACFCVTIAMTNFVIAAVWGLRLAHWCVTNWITWSNCLVQCKHVLLDNPS